MRSLAEIQTGFAAALIDPDRPAPDDLVGPDGAPAPRRFAVYRNNVIVGLTDAIAASFPIVQKIVGEDFFRAMARQFVSDEPPRSPMLIEYGARFPDFVAGFEPAAVLSYLPDVARIERAWTEAYHAAEAVPIDPLALGRIPAEDLAGVVFGIHPSARLVRSTMPALTIWRMNASGGPIEPVDLTAGGEDVLIVRPAAEVVARRVPPGGAVFVGALMAGKPLGEAASMAAAETADFNLAANLVGLLEAGLIVHVSRPTKAAANENLSIAG
jgi:hypothetical protein